MRYFRAATATVVSESIETWMELFVAVTYVFPPVVVRIQYCASEHF